MAVDSKLDFVIQFSLHIVDVIESFYIFYKRNEMNAHRVVILIHLQLLFPCLT